MTKQALLLAAVVGLASCRAEVCSVQCHDEVEDRCVPAMMRRAGVTEEVAIGRCQRAINLGRNPMLTNAGCATGCTLDFSDDTLDNGYVDNISGSQTSNAEACSSTCVDEVYNRCVPFWMQRGQTQEEATAFCAEQVASGTAPPLLRAGCAPGCTLGDGSDGTGGEGGSGGSSTIGGGGSQPSSPTLCTSANQGRCDCANLKGPSFAGFNTYTWWINGKQRCATTYLPPVPSSATERATNRAITSTEKLPVVLAMNCYARDRVNTQLVAHAKRFGMAVVHLSSPEGSWSWKNAVSNDANPMSRACSASTSGGGGEDYTYIEDVLGFLANGPDRARLDLDRVYAQGHSQNGMGAGYVGLCFPPQSDRPGIAGVWQGAAGLYEQEGGSGPTPPGREGTCADCQYWPVYPCYEGSANDQTSAVVPLTSCIQVSVDDRVTTSLSDPQQSHGQNMYNRLLQEGGDGRLLTFDGIGHRQPDDVWDWVAGCLGVTQACSAACEASVVQCVQALGHYSSCLSSMSGPSQPCAAGCAPTLSMLETHPDLMEVTLSRDAFGDDPVVNTCRPSTSQCVSDRVPGVQAFDCRR